MASVAAASSPITFAASFLRTTKPFPLSPRFLPIRTLRCALSSSSEPIEFDITFAPPKPTTPSSPRNNPAFQQLFIPWIVRGEDGKLKVQNQPPAHLIHALADATTQNPKKKVKKKKKPQASATSASSPPAASEQPKLLSKAARRYYNENIKEPPQRLSKVLAAAGVASRRTSEELIFDGKVTVNGSLCTTPQTRVDPTRDIIYVNGNRVPKKLPPKVYFALNKPKGYICSSGEKETKSVISLFDEFMASWILSLQFQDKRNPGTPKPRLFTVGRLDVATTGLIIVTNDGDFAQKLSHPSSSLPKEYITTVAGDVHKRHLMAISEGTVVEGVHCVPDSVELMPKQHDIPRARLRIVVHEGRNHEVRELVKNAGLEVYSLKRVRIGGFRLPSDLGLGKHVELKQSELKAMGWKS